MLHCFHLFTAHIDLFIYFTFRLSVLLQHFHLLYIHDTVHRNKSLLK